MSLQPGAEGVDRADGVAVLRAAGELDAARAPQLLPRADALLDGELRGARGVVLDLSRVTFFDSSGVRLLDRLLRGCAARGARVRVVAPPGSPTRRVLELVGMTGPLVEDDLGAARRSVAEPR